MHGPVRRFARSAGMTRIAVMALVASGLLLSPTGPARGIPPTFPPPTGTITEYRPTGISATANSDPVGIAFGADGNVYYTDADPGPSAIGMMSPTGTGLVTVTTTTGGSTPVAITAKGSTMWFAENSTSANQVGQAGTSLATATMHEFA